MDNNFRLFFAPGRVNLIGEHTDYNGGHVFPCAITWGTYLAARMRRDSKIKLYSLNRSQEGIITTSCEDIMSGKKEDRWTDYPKGVLYTFMKEGYHLESGFDLIYYGNLPNGAGLSSSASIEVVTAYMLCSLCHFDISGEKLALMCQKAENEYNGMKCGIMDQFAIAMGKKESAIFLNTMDLSYQYVPLHLTGYRLVVANTNKPHKLTESKYNERRKECEEALGDIREKSPLSDLACLCDLDIDRFEAVRDNIENVSAKKRAKHAVYENVRTTEAVSLLKEGKIEKFGELMKTAHMSMKEDFEATGEELDALAEAAWEEAGCIGSRMTGGGFGGCTVSIVREDAVSGFIANVGEKYKNRTGYTADFYEMEIGGGPCEISVESDKVLLNQTADVFIMSLAAYGLATGLIVIEDIHYTINSLLTIFGRDEYTKSVSDVCSMAEVIRSAITRKEAAGAIVTFILDRLNDYAYKNGIMAENGTVYRDLFDTKLMGKLTPRPSEVIEKFAMLYKKSSQSATDWFYEFSKDTNYIRRTRIQNDMKWKTQTEYGELDMTINLSKPEKDPKAIAAAGRLKPSGYPKCQLCMENEGYAGRLNHPARQNHRVIPIVMKGKQWGFQYSPYVYYNEHCIAFNSEHVPMKINHDTFCKLIDFIKIFPHYFIGSNADLPIVGGSILSHDHFQGGHYTFAMERAPIEQVIEAQGFEEVSMGIVKWPMSVIRISSQNDTKLIALADKILEAWREYTDSSVSVYAYTEGVPHNTITPIARMRDGNYEFDLVLRNNLTTKERPLGVFHPNEKLHHIKKENIGLIEVMGLAVLPARLKKEMSELHQVIMRELQQQNYSADKIAQMVEQQKELQKHAEWTKEFLSGYRLCELDEQSLSQTIKNEISKVFVNVLSDAGVFKRDEEGREAFSRFFRVAINS